MANPLDRACALAEQLEGFARELAADTASSLTPQQRGRSDILAWNLRILSIATELRIELEKWAERPPYYVSPDNPGPEQDRAINALWAADTSKKAE